jgi:TonB family protein
MKILIALLSFLLFGGISELFAQKDSLLAKEKSHSAISDIVQPDTIKRVSPREVNLAEVQRLVGYPIEAREAGIQGDLIFRVHIDESGNYIEHIILKTGDPILIEAVEKHISKVIFTPAIQDGKPIKFWVNLPFVFIVEDGLPKRKKRKK